MQKTKNKQTHRRERKKQTKNPLLNWYLQRVSTNQEKIAICKRDQNQKNRRKCFNSQNKKVQ